MIEVEREMARAALRLAAFAGVPGVALAWLLRGSAGGFTAAGTLAVVFGNFILAGYSLAWAGRKGLVALQAVALGGTFLRIAALGLAVVLLQPVRSIDRPVLAIAATVGILALLITETRLVLADRRLSWVVDRPAAS